MNAETLHRFEQLQNKMYEVLTKHQHEADNVFFGNAVLWTLELTDNKRILGDCNYSRRRIRLKVAHVEFDDMESVMDTLLHECAHALCGVTKSVNGRYMHHGAKWKQWARRLGAVPAVTKNIHYPNDSLVKRAQREGKKWLIVSLNDDDSITPWGTCGRRLKHMARRYYPYAKEATDGKLWLIPTEFYANNKTNFEAIKSNLVR